jgi:transcriptional regulator with XRE-family HTH domain
MRDVILKFSVVRNPGSGNMKSFTQRLIEDVRTYRTTNSLSQTKFGKRVGASQEVISDFERGECLPRREVLDKLYGLIYQGEAPTSVAEEPPVYHAQRNFVRWLQDILKDEIPYDEMMSILHDAVDAEWARVTRNKPQQKDATKKDQASGAAP